MSECNQLIFRVKNFLQTVLRIHRAHLYSGSGYPDGPIELFSWSARSECCVSYPDIFSYSNAPEKCMNNSTFTGVLTLESYEYH